MQAFDKTTHRVEVAASLLLRFATRSSQDSWG
jgi:hypothetical protein